MKTLRLKREQALARRSTNLVFWQGQLKAGLSDAERASLDAKINRTETDITNLKRKLGVL
jgi:hypothetical protein